jgi:hypothetical protein
LQVARSAPRAASVDWQNPLAPVVVRAVDPAVAVTTLAPLVEVTE